MSIGATLAAARRRAGVSVGELSQRTRIRENIIQGIEQDDYAACGGDFYARGHIRALATAVGTDPQPLIDEFDATWRTAKEMTAAEAFAPGMPIRTRERRRVRWIGLLAAVVLAVLGFASYKFVSGAGHSRPAAATSPHQVTGGPAAPSSGPGVQASTASASTGSASPTTATSAAASPSPSPTPAAVQPLQPASVAAFGPGGTADGDNPGQAALVLGGSGSPWTSDWYATASFGDLQSGTGLLVDMGRTVTISSVRLRLAPASGADLQLRVGTQAVLADLRPVAGSSGPGGTVQLNLATPAQTRYLLIWFTQLPPDGTGTYQASVYQVTVQGQP